jgi:hypothetical protein
MKKAEVPDEDIVRIASVFRTRREAAQVQVERLLRGDRRWSNEPRNKRHGAHAEQQSTHRLVSPAAVDSRRGATADAEFGT